MIVLSLRRGFFFLCLHLPRRHSSVLALWSGSVVDYVKMLYYTLTKLKPGAYLVPDLSARNHPS